MKEVAFLTYTFMFDPSKTWSNLYTFEKDLAKFFGSKGLEAMVVKTVQGQASNRILMITVKEKVPEPKPPKANPVPTKKMFQNLMTKKK